MTAALNMTISQSPASSGLKLDFLQTALRLCNKFDMAVLLHILI